MAVVAQDDDGSMLEREPAERALELVSVEQRAGLVHDPGVTSTEDPDGRSPSARLPSFVVAGTDEQPIRPGLEALRITQLGQSLPDVQERLLGRILGLVDITQDRMGDREERSCSLAGQASERLLIAMLSSRHQLDVHCPVLLWHGIDSRA